ncbi:hypothetical protein QQ045_032388 [Rhodiola kirilowii]
MPVICGEEEWKWIMCKVCGAKEESSTHVIKDCWWANALWNVFGLNYPSGMENIKNPADWLWWYAHRMSGKDFSEGLIVAWLCWQNRNRVWHEKEGWNVDRATIIGRSMLNSMQSITVANPSENANVTGTWSPPKDGVVKINVDGSWRQDDRGAGIGIVARDHSGSLLWIWAEQLQHVLCGQNKRPCLTRGLESCTKERFRKIHF